MNDEIHTYVIVEKNKRSPERLEETNKILRKTCGLWAHSIRGPHNNPDRVRSAQLWNITPVAGN